MINMKHMLCRTLLPLAFALLNAPFLAAEEDRNSLAPLIPLPAEMELGKGFFQLSDRTLFLAGPRERDVARILQISLFDSTGLKLKAARSFDPEKDSDAIVLRFDPALESIGEEGYILKVTPNRILIQARSSTGLFYGGQTVCQLLREADPIEGTGGPRYCVPCCSITDYPRFGWRGLMLDCSRTFQSIEYIKKTIDRMSFYKMNVLHLHLTDDQGWRLEIEKYPELTRKGANFPAKWKEPESHQGFYTRQQMIDLVRYARSRGVTIVPEIEMPGHTLAVLSCYPHLSCTGGPFEIHPFFKGPGIHKDIFCAGNDAVFEFLENVLKEVFAIFPSHYIHIGGDEAPKSRWQACPKCQSRMKQEGLKSEHELQSYFIKRIEKFVNSRGHSIIGWDEILEGGLAPNAAVMSWRGIEGGIAAARSGHNVVMSPTSHCYFDYTYGRIDSRRAYSFEPVPESLIGSQRNHVLGLQANFWSHIDREPYRVDWQLFPRLLAVAERGWSREDVQSWPDFEKRLHSHLSHLSRLKIGYRPRPAGTWTPRTITESYRPVTWDATDHIIGPGSYCIRLIYTHGAHRLGIESVALLADSNVVSLDSHRGVTGARHENNTYVVRLDKSGKTGTYTIRAIVRSEGGTDSHGEVFVIKRHEK